ncbi:NAD(P)H-dependent oxidoreductase [Candidatus Litorirhabdus singularis]|uniref:NAD(P)H-dependent oxidoreductase n=1 Tax=Candidatus Litorirhabdus singularis TaxID=2518993 RepID=UPI00242DFBF7|nr:NAD(P)H-dependent oxidoreductase [Candidatus Litorirhabdus singularis]
MAREAAAAATAGSDINVRTVRAVDAGIRDLATADGLLLALAENSAAASGAMKDFLDRTFYPAQPLQLNLPYALLLSAGNDGRGAVQQVQRILRGFPMKEVALPVICRGEVNADYLQRSGELGLTLAAGLELGIF